MKKYLCAFLVVSCLAILAAPTVTRAQTASEKNQQIIALLQQVITLLELQKQYVLQNPPTEHSSSSATSFTIVRAEHAVGAPQIEVYFDKPVYKDNNSLCYLSDTLTDLKSLCALDSRNAQIVTADDVSDVPVDTIRPTDERDLSHITIDIRTEDMKKLDDDTPRYIEMVNMGNNITPPAPFPIHIYKKDLTQLKINRITLALQGKTTTQAHIGDTIVAHITTNKSLWGMGFSARVHDSVAEIGHDLTIAKIGDTEYTATTKITPDFHPGPLSFEFYNFADMWQTGTGDDSIITTTTDGSTITLVP